MKKFFFSYFFLTIFIIVFSIVTFLSIDSNFRRSFFSLSLGLINNYFNIVIKQDLIQPKPNINAAINKLELQIKVADFLTTKSKNSFLDNIYFNAYNIESFISEKNNYNYFSNTIQNLIKKDPKLYHALIWQAKLMNLKGSDKEKIIKNINEAIKLSPANLEAYKFILDYTREKEYNDLFNQYCVKYHESILGGETQKNAISSAFTGTTLSKFIIQIEPKKNKEEFYVIEGISLDADTDYEVTLKKPSNLKGLNLFFNFFPGTALEFIKIEITDTNNVKTELPLNSLFINSRHSFFQKDKDKLKLVTTNKNDEKIQIRLNKNYKNITKIKIKLNFGKLNLTNQPNC